MKSFGIEKPCSENWNEMTPNENGAYCQKCALNVIDFTDKSNTRIKQLLLEASGKHLCGRLMPVQEEAINKEFEAWKGNSQKNIQRAFLVSLLVVFGLSIFSCSNQGDKKALTEFRNSVKEIVDQQPEKTYSVAEEKVVIPAVPAVAIDHTDNVICYGEAQAPEELDEVVVISERYGSYAGGISYRTVEFENFLIDTIPVDEYDESGNLIPKEFSALAFPNPTANVATLELKIPSKDNFQIDLMDMNGRHLQNVHSGKIERGTFHAEFNLSDLPAGTYLIAVLSAEFKEVVRIIKL